MRVVLVLLALVACRRAPAERVEMTVTTALPGASPATIESAITTPLERHLARLAGLERITSWSTRGHSTITLVFSAATTASGAQDAVGKSISTAAPLLPPTLPAPPIYARPSRKSPVLRLVLSSTTIPLRDLSVMANRMADGLAQVAGVGQVVLCGARSDRYEIHINPKKLTGSGQTLEQVMETLHRVAVDLSNLAKLGLVRNVATIRTGETPPTCRAAARGAEVVTVTVRPLLDSDPLAVRQALDPVLGGLLRQLPAHLGVNLVTASTTELSGPPLVASALTKLATDEVLVELDDNGVVRLTSLGAPAALQVALVTAAESSLVPIDASTQLVILQSADPVALAAALSALAKAPTLHVISTIGTRIAPTIAVSIDRDRAVQLGVTSYAATLAALEETGTVVAMQSIQGEQVPTVLFVDPTDPPGQILELLHLTGTNQTQVPLSAVAAMRRTVEPLELLHEGGRPMLGLRVTGSRVEVEATLAAIPVPAGIERTLRL